MKHKIACIQMCSGEDITANIVRVETLVAEAAGSGAEFVATPENTFRMEMHNAPRSFHTMDDHPGVKAASEMAGRFGIWLLVGSVNIKAKEDGKAYNRSLLFSPKGELAAHYDKIHLFDVEVGDGQTYKESSKIMSGGKAVTSDMGWAKLGMTVCYDVRFPQLYRSLAKMGADIISVPSAFTQVTGEAHWHTLLRARAIENACFVVAPAQTGVHPGDRKTFGHSLIIDPWGRVLADGGKDEGVVMAEIHLGNVTKTRTRMPSLKHDREFS